VHAVVPPPLFVTIPALRIIMPLPSQPQSGPTLKTKKTARSHAFT
jgi:hypothetical protein